jgi:hypothetical protein
MADFPFKAVGNIASLIEFYLAVHDVVAGKPILDVNYLSDNLFGLWLSLGPEMLEVLIRTLRKGKVHFLLHIPHFLPHFLTN